jgi:hypothetical protein
LVRSEPGFEIYLFVAISAFARSKIDANIGSVSFPVAVFWLLG